MIDRLLKVAAAKAKGNGSESVTWSGLEAFLREAQEEERKGPAEFPKRMIRRMKYDDPFLAQLHFNDPPECCWVTSRDEEAMARSQGFEG